MKFIATCFYQGSESRSGIKDPTKIYYEVSLLDDVDQLKCFTNQELFDKILPGIPRFAPCNCTFELNTRFNTLRLIDIAKVK